MTNKTSWKICLAIIVVYLILYGTVVHLPIQRHAIPFSLGEEKIPFLPWTFIIYLSVFVQAAVIIRRTPRRILFKIVVPIFVMLSVGLLFFILLPIEYSRNLYPTSNPLALFVRSLDGAGNCFPSLHVATSLLLASSFGMMEKSKKNKWLMGLWTFVIVFSVLTTKQHYLVDVFGGIVLMTPFYIWIKRQLAN